MTQIETRLSSLFSFLGIGKREQTVNPREVNFPILEETLESMIRDIEGSGARNISFTIKQPVTIHLRNGSTSECELLFVGSHHKAALAVMSKKEEPIASRIWHVSTKYARRLTYTPTNIYIWSDSGTVAAWEGNGLGSSLLLLSDRVITHQMQYFDMGDLPIIANVTDGAVGTTRNRRGWTSFFAKQMGYTELHENSYDWYKQYR